MKIYDVVFYYKEPKVLELRLSYLKKFVDRTIVYNFGNDDIQIEDVEIINVETGWDNFKEKNFCFDLLDYIGKKNISYDDVFIFSKTFEIPCQKCFDLIRSDYNGGFQNTAQKVYQFNTKYKSLYKSNGSMIAKMMDLMSSDISQNFIFDKRDYIFSPENFWDCGFSFSCFESENNNLNSLKFWFPDFFMDIKTSDLVDYSSFKTNIFPNQKKHKLILSDDCPYPMEEFITEPKIKKVLITTQSNFTHSEKYDRKIILSYEDLGFENQVIVNKPTSTHYNSEEYYKDFLINESLVILKTLFLNSNDLIYLKTKTEGLPSVFTYDFFINSVPSELT
jgi:hypothetical protein